MTICYICNKPHEITQEVEHHEICLDCLRKVNRCVDLLDVSLPFAVEIIKHFQEDKEKQ